MPGKKALEKKSAEVKELTEKFNGAKGIVVVDYRGITVEQITNLRNDLRKENIEYKVAKNTLIKLAVKGTEYEGLTEYLEGPTAIAISHEDCTAPARIIAKTVSDVEPFSFKCGWVEGNVYDAKGIEELSKIPSKEVLIAKVLGGFNAPITSLAYVLKAIAEKQEANA